MTRRLLASYVTITIVVLAVLEIPLGVVFSRYEHRKLGSQLNHDALALAVLSDETLEGSANANLSGLVRRYERQTGGRVVIFDAKGRSIADSSTPTAGSRALAHLPEVQAALAGQETSGARSNTLYVATPVSSGTRVSGAVLITYTPTVVNSTVRRGWFVLGVFGAGILTLVSALSVVLARSVTRPLRQLEGASAKLADGSLSARADTTAGPDEIRMLATSFNEMAARLEHLVRSQEGFVADASHQLRTPLQALRLRLENAEASSGRDAAIDIRGALDEVDRLGRLVDGLLQLAQADVDAPATAPVDVSGVIRERVQAWEALAKERSVVIRAELSDGDAVVSRDHITTTLDNLISNALAVSPRGGAIDIACARVDPWVEVHVIDGGPGMSAEERKRATDRFWRAPGSAKRGSGLGLAIARRLIEVDHGSMELREAEAGGVDVVIKLRPAVG